MADDPGTVEETTHTPEGVPEPPKPPEATKTDDHLKDMVLQLQETVNNLAQTVASIAPARTDETPTHKPWTHRNFS